MAEDPAEGATKASDEGEPVAAIDEGEEMSETEATDTVLETVVPQQLDEKLDEMGVKVGKEVSPPSEAAGSDQSDERVVIAPTDNGQMIGDGDEHQNKALNGAESIEESVGGAGGSGQSFSKEEEKQEGGGADVQVSQDSDQSHIIHELKNEDSPSANGSQYLKDGNKPQGGSVDSADPESTHSETLQAHEEVDSNTGASANRKPTGGEDSGNPESFDGEEETETPDNELQKSTTIKNIEPSAEDAQNCEGKDGSEDEVPREDKTREVSAGSATATDSLNDPTAETKESVESKQIRGENDSTEKGGGWKFFNRRQHQQPSG